MLDRQLTDQGMDSDAADKKAGAIVAKKYHLASDWHLPIGNSLQRIERDSLDVDTSPAAAWA